MRLLFVRATSPGSLLIRAFEGGEASHVGIVDGDYVIDATFAHGVARRPLADFMRRRELVADIVVPTPDDAAGLAWARTQIGKPYDWLALVGFLLWRDLSNPGSGYCSLLARGALLQAGLTFASLRNRWGVRLMHEVAHARTHA